ncbi:MarR family winged helix-turn-helix transcriptional regulator [Aquamicrobium terrae]|uniref:DNA-binding MarR family transcriptional regulator n=1 Tax=Aquamicrobium terrae TaxID=1324945 RepID=A0ABV2N6J5_9HYPH
MAKADRTATMNRLHSAARLARTALAARLLAHGFYAGQDQIMLALDRDDGQTPGALADRLGVRPPTITKTINRLQAQGFLEKRNSNSDARQAHIFLTDAGREMIVAIEKSVKKTEKQALKGLDKKEQKTLAKLLARIEANLSNEELVFIDDEAEPEADAKPDAKSAAKAEADADA